jgi:hypothetical protein
LRSHWLRLNLLGKFLAVSTFVLFVVVCLTSWMPGLLGLAVALSLWGWIILAGDPLRRFASGDDPARDVDRLDKREY